MLQIVTNFIHSKDFWRWHGFVLSILWLLGSAIGIALKKRNLTLHIITFVLIDYISLFFMGSAIYLIFPKLDQFWTWNTWEKVHIVGGLVFLLLLTYQHVGGAISWHKEQPNRNHRKYGTKIALMARILAGIGWMIHEEGRNWAIVTFGGSLLLYALAERASWAKIKTN